MLLIDSWLLFLLAGNDCIDDSVRLQNAPLSPQIGRVEVCSSGRWGLVCSRSWDNIDGQVACRQLGYEGIRSSYL